MKTITYAGVRVGVETLAIGEDGQPGKLLRFIDPETRDVIEFPMSERDAQNIANQLRGVDLQVVGAGQAPPPPPAPPAPPAPSPEPLDPPPVPGPVAEGEEFPEAARPDPGSPSAA